MRPNVLVATILLALGSQSALAFSFPFSLPFSKSPLELLAENQNNVSAREEALEQAANPAKKKEVIAEWLSFTGKVLNANSWAKLGEDLMNASTTSTSVFGRPAVLSKELGGPVVQNDSIINIDRVYAESYKPGYSVLDNGYVMNAPLVPHESDVASSVRRMMQGRAPAGPDGLPISICQMGIGHGFTLYEVSQTQIQELKNSSALSFPACKSSSELASYWKVRVADFYAPSARLTARNVRQVYE